jgi:hypothetical protein
MTMAFPGVRYKLDKQDWFAEFGDQSQIWFGGLDDKERTEKILGQEYVTIYLNECSQIPQPSRETAVTRLAQQVRTTAGHAVQAPHVLRLQPAIQGALAYKLFVQKIDPDTKKPLAQSGRLRALPDQPADNPRTWPRATCRRFRACRPGCGSASSKASSLTPRPTPCSTKRTSTAGA